MNLVAVLDSITVDNEGKTTYKVGESLNLDDVVVTAHYSDKTTQVVTDQATFNPPSHKFTTDDIGPFKITASYNEGAVTKTGEFTVTVIPATLESITVTAPSDTEYKVGESVD
ncbi:MAG: bacterial Ig-like domain-containing protein [Mycoplasmoidaceae bacterium]|nr:bacterial Ig-like domain-containing protein [Mycoplasmoidaceae bacterium]